MEKLGEAVERLVVGTGPIQERLEEARLVLLHLDPANSDEVPTSVGPSLATLTKDLNQLASADGGAPTIARDTVSIVECQRHARNILFLHSLMYGGQLKHQC